MSSWLSWMWGNAEEVQANKLINPDILEKQKASLRHVKPPEEHLHIVEFRPAILAPTANLNLIKRSWLGVGEDILKEAIRNLRPVATNTKPVLRELSLGEKVMQELLQKTTRIEEESPITKSAQKV